MLESFLRAAHFDIFYFIVEDHSLAIMGVKRAKKRKNEKWVEIFLFLCVLLNMVFARTYKACSRKHMFRQTHTLKFHGGQEINWPCLHEHVYFFVFVRTVKKTKKLLDMGQENAI